MTVNKSQPNALQNKKIIYTHSLGLSPPPILEFNSNFAPNYLRTQIMDEWDPEFLLWREDKVAVDTATRVYSLLEAKPRALDPNYFQFHKWYLIVNNYPIGLNKTKK